MQVIINLEKRHLVFFVVLVCVLFVVGVSASTYKLGGVGHDANETGPGTFGGNPADTYIFPGFVRANEFNATTAITLNGERKTSWPSGAAVSLLPAVNISNGTFGANVGNGNFGFPSVVLFPNNDPNNGIFWATTRDTSKPHIDYDSASGLWVSGGANYLTPVNFEGDVTVKSQILGYNYSFIYESGDLGSWTTDQLNHRCSCDTNGSLIECPVPQFSASSSDYNICYDLYRDANNDRHVRMFVKNPVIKGGHLNVTDVNAYQIEVNNTLSADTVNSKTSVASNSFSGNLTVSENLTLGGVPRDSWPPCQRVVYGIVDSTGAKYSGQGFSSALSAATYTVTFDKPFSSIPAVSVINFYGAAQHCGLPTPTSLADLKYRFSYTCLHTTTGGAQYVYASFIAVGEC